MDAASPEADAAPICPPVDVDCSGIQRPPENAMTNHPIVFIHGMGGFESVRSDVLVHVDEMREHRNRAQKIASRFRAPNEDEIDRMLLEE